MSGIGPWGEGGEPQVCRLYVSAGHNFFGRHGQPAGTHPMVEVSQVHCLAGRGIEGDRFLDFRPDYKGQVTFFSREVYDDLCVQLGVQDRSPSVFRRNIVVQGVDLNVAIGREFLIQGVRFQGVAECSPCHWMDEAFAPGAELALRGRGGLRARILTGGWLTASGR